VKLSYTNRLIGVFALYTFIFTLVIVSISWVYVETKGSVDVQQKMEEMRHLEQFIRTGQPDTQVLRYKEYDLYLPGAELPPKLYELKQPGLYEIDGKPSVYVGQHPVTDEIYHLVLDHKYELLSENHGFEDFAALATAVILTTLFATLLLVFLARRVAYPILALKAQIETIDIESDVLPEVSRQDEIGQLNQSFADMLCRVRGFINREKEFTRYASHELRSPVTVLRGNLDILQTNDNFKHNKALRRMDSAVRRMSLIIESFLWLAREKEAMEITAVNIDKFGLQGIINDLGLESAQQARLELKLNSELHWFVRQEFLSLLLANLIQNAIRHCQGAVELEGYALGFKLRNAFDERAVAISKGIGLQIVQRLCDSQGWTLNIDWDKQYFVVEVGLGNKA